MKVRQWSFFYGALLACAAFGLLASTSAEVSEAPKRSSAAEVAFAGVAPSAAPPAAIAELGSMTVRGSRIVLLGSMTVTARRVRVA